MVDQVTRSVVFLQRQYPSNKWVLLLMPLVDHGRAGLWSWVQPGTPDAVGTWM